MTTQTYTERPERVMLTLRHGRGTEWFVVGAFPTSTKGLYVHEYVGHEFEPGRWQLTSGYGCRIGNHVFDSYEATVRAAEALAAVRKDWSALAPGSLPPQTLARVVTILRRCREASS